MTPKMEDLEADKRQFALFYVLSVKIFANVQPHSSLILVGAAAGGIIGGAIHFIRTSWTTRPISLRQLLIVFTLISLIFLQTVIWRLDN